MADKENLRSLSDDELSNVAGGTVDSYSGVCKTCMAITTWVKNFWGNGFECSVCHENNPGTFYDLQKN